MHCPRSPTSTAPRGCRPWGPAGDPRYRELLQAQSRRTGYGVLCNTSLNFKGTGFINRSSDLFHYCERTGIDHAVVEDAWYRRVPAS